MGIENVANLLSGVTSAIGALSDKKTITKRGGSTVSQGLELSQEAVDAITRDILQSNSGLAAVSSGQKSSGMYNSTTNQQLVNDLVARASAETAKAQAKTVTTTSPSQDVAMQPAALSMGDAALGLGGAMLANKLWQASGAGDWIDETLGGIFKKGAGDAVDGVASIVSNGFDPFGAAAEAFSGSIGDLAGIGDLSGMPFASMGMDFLSGDVGGALQSGATYMAMNTLLPGSGFLAPLLGDLAPLSAIGDLASSLVGGLGDMLGGLFGGGSVVCTQLVSVGLMSQELYFADIKYARTHMEERTLRGYRLFGVPLVRLMRRSSLVTGMVAYFAVARAHYIASLDGGVAWEPKLARRGERVQRYGVPLCNFLSRFTTSLDDTVRTHSLYC